MKKKLSKIPAKGWFASGGKYHKLQKRGFSLIEVLLSLVVLSFGITAVAVLMVNNIKNLQTSKNQIIALQLAQEGIELVRNLKDNNTAFISKPTAPKVDGSDYSIDKDTSFGDFSSDADAKRLNLTVPPAAIFYTHSGTTATKFFRKIKI